MDALVAAEASARQHAVAVAEPGIVLSPEQAMRQVQLLLLVVAASREGLALLQEAEAGMEEEDAGEETPLAGAERDLAELSQELGQLETLFSTSEGSAVAGRFEWVDGALTRAVQHGGWVLLDNANLVNPTVLDRLNPLLEPGGSLYLPECGNNAGGSGGPRVVQPHPDFRLLLAMDPRHGEVSRAMRNRGIEVCMLPPVGASASPPPPALKRPAAEASPAAPTSSVVGIPADPRSLSAAMRSGGALCMPPPVASAMAAAHSCVEAACRAAHRRAPTSSDLASWAGLTQSLLNRGRPLRDALAAAWQQVYPSALGLPPREAASAQKALDNLLAQLTAAAGADVGQRLTAVADLDAMDVEEEVACPLPADEERDEDEERDRELQAPDPNLASAAASTLVLLGCCAASPASLSLTPSVPLLAGDSSLAAVLRDASLLEHLLGLCLSAEQRTSNISIPPSTLLPSSVLAPILHGGARGAALALGDENIVSSEQLQGLHRLAWSAASVFLQRSTPSDTRLRLLVLAGLVERASAAGTGFGAAAATGTAKLAALLPALAKAFLSDPLVGRLREALGQALGLASPSAADDDATTAGGLPPRLLLALQPLDLRYCQLYQQRLATAPASGWSLVWRLQVREILCC